MAAPAAAQPVDNSDLNDAVVGAAPAAPQVDNSDLNDAVVGTAPAAPQPQPNDTYSHVLPPANDPYFFRRDLNRVKGFVKGAAHTIAGATDIANTDTGLMEQDPNKRTYLSPGLHRLVQSVQARTQLNNPDQETGDFVESALEFLPLMAEEAPGKVVSLADKLGMGQEVAKFAQKFPRLATAWNIMRAGAETAARAGGEQGAQTYVKTGGDAPRTVAATETGATVGGLLGAGTQAAGELGEAINARRAGSRSVAGARFETRPKTGDVLLRNTKDGVQDPATKAVDEAMGNIAKTGVANSLNRANAARAPEGEIIPPSRRLPGSGGFTVGPAAEPTPVVEGQTAFEPGKQQIGTRAVEGKGPGTFDYAGYSPELFDADAEQAAQEGTLGASRPLAPQQGSHREPIVQYRNAVKPGSPEPGTDVATGPGMLILTDDGQAMSPQRARQQLAQYDQILNDPDEVDQMGVRKYQDIQRAREDMTGQLSRYDNYAASQPHFSPHDVLETVRNTGSLGEASKQLKAAYGPFWDAADDVSGGEFSVLRDEEKRLQKQIYGANPTGRLDDLRQQLAENQQKQMDFFDKYKTTVSPQEWDTHRAGWQDAIVLGNLDNMLQKQFGGISRELEQRGIASGNPRQRVFQPGKNFNQQLEDFYNDGFRGSATNRAVLERTIGKEHMDSLHDLGLMFKNSERMEQTQGLMKTTLSSILHHYHGVRGMLAAGGGGLMLASTLGAREAGLAGVPLMTGTAAGVRNYITNKLITDPSFLKTFSYALDKIPARTAGPLLAARLISQWHNQSLKQPAAPTGGK